MSNLAHILMDVLEHALPLKPRFLRVTCNKGHVVFETMVMAKKKAMGRKKMKVEEIATVVFRAQTHAPLPELQGRFAIDHLPTIKRLLAGGKLSVDNKQPAFIFGNKGKGTVTWRLTTDRLPKVLQFQEGLIKWDVIIKQPQRKAFERFDAFFKNITKVCKVFSFKKIGKKLIVVFSSEFHKVKWPFADEVKGQFKCPYYFDAKRFAEAFKFAIEEQSQIQISQKGIIKIGVRNELLKYEYIFCGVK